MESDSIVNGVLGVAATAIGVLWKASESKNAKAIQGLEERLVLSEKRHDDCQDDRDVLRIEMAQMRGELNHIKRGD